MKAGRKLEARLEGRWSQKFLKRKSCRKGTVVPLREAGEKETEMSSGSIEGHFFSDIAREKRLLCKTFLGETWGEQGTPDFQPLNTSVLVLLLCLREIVKCHYYWFLDP